MSRVSESYEYVIVGAGSSGCVLANRLVQAGAGVLLIEAGKRDRGLAVRAPLGFAAQFMAEGDWNFVSEPEPGLNGRRIHMPRGKIMGGTSSMNAMMYIRGNRTDYDGWASDFGATGWSYDDVLPLFKRSERNQDLDDEYHGTQGELYVTNKKNWYSSHLETFKESAIAVGLEPNPDFNGASQDGVGHVQATIRGGRRWSAADAFIRPVRRARNLTIATQAHVRRVMISAGRATGVEFDRSGATRKVRAEREVILSAGAYGSPQLLMLSGVGPAEHLREHGIEIALDSPNVGSHLQEHPIVFMNWRANDGPTTVDDAGPKDIVKWLLTRKGRFSTNLAEAAFHWRSDPQLPAPDFQVVFVPAYFWDSGFRKIGANGISMLISYLGPRSRGTVRLRSADPYDQPRILSNLLGHPEEPAAFFRVIELIRDIASRRPFADILGEEMNPSLGLTSANELAGWLRSVGEHTYHPSCSCRIGPPASGAVDHELRVHGIDGLRVADASVMPQVTHGNTHAPCVMIGEKASDLILADRA